jgi:hypothetical protein
VHVHVGKVAAADEAAGAVSTACPTLAWFSLNIATKHMVQWTAPTTTECVTVSAAQASGPKIAFKTNKVRTRSHCCRPLAITCPLSTLPGVQKVWMYPVVPVCQVPVCYSEQQFLAF